MANITKEEKIIVIVLILLLYTGALLLHIGDTHPQIEIKVVHGKIKEELSLKEVENRLRENRKIHINTATPEELTRIPGIGGILAERIISYRKSVGSFKSKAELLNIEGIGTKKFEKIREYIILK